MKPFRVVIPQLEYCRVTNEYISKEEMSDSLKWWEDMLKAYENKIIAYHLTIIKEEFDSELEKEICIKNFHLTQKFITEYKQKTLITNEDLEQFKSEIKQFNDEILWLQLSKINFSEFDSWKKGYFIIKEIYSILQTDLVKTDKRLFDIKKSGIWKWMNEAERRFYDIYTIIGGVALYPLYYVNGYYLDFASPKHKFGIEVDGEKYHNLNKDKKRDSHLLNIGWKIYHIKATDIFKPQKFHFNFENYLGIEEEFEEINRELYLYFLENAAGLCHSLRGFYYDNTFSETSLSSLKYRMLN